MTNARIYTASVLGLRIAYGLGLLLTPTKLGRPWIGDAAAANPTKVGLRGVGAREIALHGAALAVTLGGGDVRPFLAASVATRGARFFLLAGDLSDIAATAAARKDIPEGAAVKTAAAAGGSAALTVLAAVLVD